MKPPVDGAVLPWPSPKGPAAEACDGARRAYAMGAALGASGQGLERLRALDADQRPFAFEGAGSVAGWPDEGASALERLFVDLGRGMAEAFTGAGAPPDGPLADGHGFGRTLLRPDRLPYADEGPRAWWVGAGRALWFLHAGAVRSLRAAVLSCPAARRAALWDGVGRAAVTTGGGPPERLAALMAAAGPHAEELRDGARFAAALRLAWGRSPADTSPRFDDAELAKLLASTALVATPLPGIAAVRGMGVVSAAGTGCPALLALIAEGRSAIAPVRRFPVDRFGASAAALVSGHDEPAMGTLPDGQAQAIALAFGVAAAREALAGPPRTAGVTALVVGSNLEDRPRALDEVFDDLADELGIDGPRVVVSTACASGAAALGHALGILARGEADRVLAGGVDVITPRVFGGFDVLGALTDRSAPFSEPAGMTLGEGAAFLVLEPATLADDAAVLGYGLGCDAFHDTRPAPDGHGVAAAIRAALAHAGVAPEAIDYVNAHGTGTEANDAAEWRGIRAGLAGYAPPVSSLKGALGHAQGAAGALEVAATLLCRQAGVLPPTAGFAEPRPGAPPDPIPVARPGRIDTFVSCNSAFGGVNVAVIAGRARAVSRPCRPVRVAGSAVWGGALGEAPPAFTARDLPRGLDPDAAGAPVAWLCAALRGALEAASFRLDRSTRPKVGLVVGLRRVLASDGRALTEEIEAHGLHGVAGSTFARSLLVSPAGSAATAFGLLGPLDVVVAGSASGALALVQAATLLAERPELDLMLAATVDEGEDEGAWSGAVAVALSPTRGAPLRAWTLAGSPVIAEGRARAAAPEAAVRRAGVRRDGVCAGESLLAFAEEAPTGAPVVWVGGRRGLGWAYALGGEG